MTRRRLLLGLVALAIVALAGVAASMRSEAAPSGAPSKDGRYRVDLAASPATSPVNQLHEWRFDLTDGDGSAVTGARVSIDGDMPAHGHGLPSQPIVREVGAGSYVVEGMKFQMGGHWFVELRIDGSEGRDTFRVDFNLPE